MPKLLFAFVIVSSSLFGQVPTQTDILKEGILKYIKGVPTKSTNYFLERLGLDKFSYYVNHRRKGHHYVTSKTDSPFYQTLYSRSHRMTPSHDYAFPFLNDVESFEDLLEVEFGLCAGVTWALRNFNLLSFYRPDLDPLSVQGNQEIINDILNGKPRLIPGFKHLQHFLSEESNLVHMKKHVILAWQKINSKILQSAVIFSSVKRSQRLKETRKVIRGLSDRLNMYHNPIIYMSKPNKKLFSKEQWIHVVQVHKIETLRGQGNYNIHVWDVNYHYPESLKKIKIRNGEATYLSEYVDDDGIYGYRDEKLAKFGELHSDRSFIGKALNNLKSFCNSNKKNGVSICIKEPIYDDCTNYVEKKSEQEDLYEWIDLFPYLES